MNKDPAPTDTALAPQSSGCLFCDMGDTPRPCDGTMAHFLPSFDIVYCTSNALMQSTTKH